MSMKDELERARREKEMASTQDAIEEKQTREQLKTRLDAIFAEYATQQRAQNHWFVDRLTNLNAVGHLRELRKECYLVYEIKSKTLEQKSAWGRISHQRFENKIPAKIELIIRGLSFRDQRAVIDLDAVTGWQSFLLDHRMWPIYQDWNRDLVSGKGMVDRQKYISHFESKIAALTIPPIEGVEVGIKWDYREWIDVSNDHAQERSFSQISAKVTRQEVEVSRNDGMKISISVDDCSSSWLKQQIANVYVK